MDGRIPEYASIDQPWLKYYSEEAVNAAIPECTVLENIWRHNREHLDDIALVYFERKITYRKVFSETERCAKALKHAGVLPGDRIPLCKSGVPEVVY
jgi:long-chain acyl-CoA synthetase